MKDVRAKLCTQGMIKCRSVTKGSWVPRETIGSWCELPSSYYEASWIKWSLLGHGTKGDK